MKRVNGWFHIAAGRNWPVYEKRWGVRVFQPFRYYGLHIHLGRWAIAIGPGRYAPNGADYRFAKATRGFFFWMD